MTTIEHYKNMKMAVNQTMSKFIDDEKLSNELALEKFNEHARFLDSEIEDKKETIGSLIFNQNDSDLIGIEIEALDRLIERREFVKHNRDKVIEMFLDIEKENIEELKKWTH